MPRGAKHGVRAFEHPLLERLSRVHPVLPAVFWGPVSLALFGLAVHGGAAPARIALVWLAGLLSWTFVEYVLHRWVFHYVPADERLRELLYPLHMLHHDAQEWDRLVAPPLMSIPAFLVFLGLFSLWPGAPRMYPLLSGFVAGYLAYDYVHLYTHFARPRSRLGKGLRRRHLHHHFASSDRWYGVSSPLWDYVFGTHVRAGERTARPRNGKTNGHLR